ncbi:MAG: phenylacetate-CoA oxygenase subunit PaaJ, partial [Woeseiaceae bacterium]|nr:phenylacetate-CoA oxygenase subunit PaaJ [Woeseiaceae bacterium]
MVGSTFEREQILEWLAEVADPEIPVLTITDLGIVRDVECDDGVTVSLTPTYSGCPATEAIETSVVAALEERGVENVRIKRVLSPPWTTDWISDEGRDKLRIYGIAPPERR